MRATDRMDELADTTSAIENRTAREIADDWINELVATADRDPDRLSTPPRPRTEVRAVRFTLTDDAALNEGRSADITFVFSTNGVVDYAVLDYSETGAEARAQRVLTGQAAQQLLAVLNQRGTQTDPPTT